MTNLKCLLQDKGITQRELADVLGVTEVSVSRYISGKRTMKVPMAIRAARYLGVDVESLYDTKHDPYAGYEPYCAEPVVEKPLIQNIDDPTLIAWFRCNSCYTCKFRKEVIDKDPERDIHWCARTHQTPHIVDMVRYLGYSKE